jgi:gas vesicle protein
MKSIAKIATAIAAAAAAGAILGVLFAPDKGSETRRKISKQGKDVADDLKNSFNKGKEKINGFREDLAKSIQEKVDEFA